MSNPIAWTAAGFGILSGLVLIAWGLFFRLLHERLAEQRRQQGLQQAAVEWIRNGGARHGR